MIIIKSPLQVLAEKALEEVSKKLKTNKTIKNAQKEIKTAKKNIENRIKRDNATTNGEGNIIGNYLKMEELKSKNNDLILGLEKVSSITATDLDNLAKEEIRVLASFKCMTNNHV